MTSEKPEDTLSEDLHQERWLRNNSAMWDEAEALLARAETAEAKVAEKDEQFDNLYHEYKYRTEERDALRERERVTTAALDVAQGLLEAASSPTGTMPTQSEFRIAFAMVRSALDRTLAATEQEVDDA